MRFRKSNAERLAPANARRQGDITRLAFTLLGREAAIEFLNSENAELGGRPLDLAIASESGCAVVEAELGRLTCRPANSGQDLQIRE
jgi:uncharacterized protein (DUF2384 family)